MNNHIDSAVQASAPNSTLTSTQPLLGKRLSMRAKVIYVSLIWLLAAFLHTLARNSGQDLFPIPPGGTLLSVPAMHFVLYLHSLLLLHVFERFGNSMLKLKNLLMLGTLSILICVPLMELFWLGAPLLLPSRAKYDFAQTFHRRGFSAWWIDSYLVLLAVSAHAAGHSWRRWQDAQLTAAREYSISLELRLRLLQGQLKPHFLFNCLNSMSSLVRTSDTQQAIIAIEKLSGLLGFVAKASKTESLSVADEIQFIRDYVDMQLLRFGERMQVEWQIEDEDWGQYVCPPMLFQPLLENAIVHGIECQREAGRIRIRLEIIGQQLVFTVDNPLVAKTNCSEGHGIGLSASRERLAILFGEQARLYLEERSDCYRASIYLPALRQP